MDILGEDSDSGVKFTINENYARRYDTWRQGEELQKLKDKYGDNSGTDTSSSEDEDEYGRELTEDIEKDFFKTLSSLKERNPKIYDKNVKFFKDKSLDATSKPVRKTEQFYSVAEYQRKTLLENGGKFSDDDDDHDPKKPLKKITNVEQEKALKQSFKDVLKESDSENEEVGWGSLFKKRIKTEEDLKTEDADYKLWLAGEKSKLQNDDDEKELKGLHDFWTDPALDEGEQFLRDYILNKRFLEKDDKSKISSYDEVVHDSDSDLSADANTLEKQEDFERKYNFRFEEPDHELVIRYPRTLEQSMRKKDEKRKKHREQVKSRKEAEKAKKIEELKRLKALKKKEIMDRIRKLQEITGNDDLGFQSKDLEGDFNPDEHDKRMSELFDESYYGTCNDDERPEFPELDKELEIENWDEWEKEQNEEELHCEDPGFNMDCDYDPAKKKSLQNELIKASKRGKKRRQSKFAAAVAKEKPLFDPKNKTFEKYIDEYYSLDYEDLIGDLPCRFKYRKVIPNDFGLSVEEILSAPDKELNSWVSVKKIMQRRPDDVEWYDVQAYKKKAKNFNKKSKCLPSLYSQKEEKIYEDSCDNEVIHTNKADFFDKSNVAANSDSALSSKKNNKGNKAFSQKGKRANFWNKGLNYTKKNSRKHQSQQSQKYDKNKFSESDKGMHNNYFSEKDSVYNISDARLKSYGINPKKLKNKLKFST